MLEINELEAARALLRQGTPLKQLKETHLEKYLKLENLLSQVVLNGEVPSYLKETKKSKRARLINSIKQLFYRFNPYIFILVIFDHVKDVPKSRLMSIISSALKWEESCGNLSGNSSYDILYGQVPAEIVDPTSLDKFPKNCYKSVKLPTASHAECAGFTPNGAYFIVGTADGFLEVWNPLEGTLRTDLPYQTGEHDLISMNQPITCISFSSDSELLACGTIKGEVVIWKLSTGKMIKTFSNVHQNGVTSISFSADSQSLLTTGFDNNVLILGMKSGRILKELRGHTSYVNCAIWLDELTILSGSHDGTVKLWDLHKLECLSTSVPKEEKSLSPPPIKSFSQLFSTEDDTFYLVTTQSSKLHLFSALKRDFVQIIPTKLKSDTHLINSIVRKGLIFSLTTDGHLFTLKSDDFNASIGSEKISQVEPIGFTLHPNLNILVTFDVSGVVKFWRS